MTPSSTAVICFLIATVAFIQSMVYVGDWYGFSCLFLGVGFAVAGVLLVKES